MSKSSLADKAASLKLLAHDKSELQVSSEITFNDNNQCDAVDLKKVNTAAKIMSRDF